MTRTPSDLYLELLKRVLTRQVSLEADAREVVLRPLRATNWKRYAVGPLQRVLQRRGYSLVREVDGRLLADLRGDGIDWPVDAETMIGRKRLDSLQECVETVLLEDVPGDLIEAGVWRGGAVILMKAVLEVRGDVQRRIWAADSFQGLPVASHPIDIPDDLSARRELAVDVETVRRNFEKYGLLDERVEFAVGWFRDTLTTLAVDELALIRLDGDYYESTQDALDALYPRLSPGGFLIVDDYGQIAGCRTAVDEFRVRHGISSPIETIDHSGIFWRRTD